MDVSKELELLIADLDLCGMPEMSSRVKLIQSHLAKTSTKKTVRKIIEPKIRVLKTQRGFTNTLEFGTTKECEKYLIQEKKNNDSAVSSFLKSINKYAPIRGSCSYREDLEKHLALLKNNGFDLHIEIQAQ